MAVVLVENKIIKWNFEREKYDGVIYTRASITMLLLDAIHLQNKKLSWNGYEWEISAWSVEGEKVYIGMIATGESK